MDEKPSDNQPQGKVIKVKRVPTKAAKLNTEELLAQVCYYYPQYTLETAALLSYRRVTLLLKVVKKQQAMHYYNLTQIAAAPHTKKGHGVKKLSEHFKKIADS